MDRENQEDGLSYRITRKGVGAAFITRLEDLFMKFWESRKPAEPQAEADGATDQDESPSDTKKKNVRKQ